MNIFRFHNNNKKHYFSKDKYIKVYDSTSLANDFLRKQVINEIQDISKKTVNIIAP